MENIKRVDSVFEKLMKNLDMTCPECGENIFRKDTNGQILPSPCRCRIAELEKYEEMEKVRKEKINKERINKLFDASRLSKRFRTRTFETFEIKNNENKKAFERAYEFSQNFQDRVETGKGLFLYGSYGSGKTHLTAAITNVLIEQGYTVIFATACEILRKFKASYDAYKGQIKNTEEDLLKAMETCDLLIIDDLGKEKLTEWAQEKFFQIINARYERQLPIVMTTNYLPSEVVEKLGGAIASRLYEICESIYTGKLDYRIEMRKQEEAA